MSDDPEITSVWWGPAAATMSAVERNTYIAEAKARVLADLANTTPVPI